MKMTTVFAQPLSQRGERFCQRAQIVPALIADKGKVKGRADSAEERERFCSLLGIRQILFTGNAQSAQRVVTRNAVFPQRRAGKRVIGGGGIAQVTYLLHRPIGLALAQPAARGGFARKFRALAVSRKHTAGGGINLVFAAAYG